MRISEEKLRNLIREVLLTEQVFGRQAFVYHGSKSPPEKFFEIVDTGTFRAGGGTGAARGPAIYSIYELGGSETTTGYYGEWIYKLKVNLDRYLVFDSEPARKIWGKWVPVSKQLADLGLSNLLEATPNLRRAIMRADVEKPAGTNTALDADLISRFAWPTGKIRGLMFTDEGARVAVNYDTNSVVPVAWKSFRDSSWNNFEISRASVARSSGVAPKNREEYLSFPRILASQILNSMETDFPEFFDGEMTPQELFISAQERIVNQDEDLDDKQAWIRALKEGYDMIRESIISEDESAAEILTDKKFEDIVKRAERLSSTEQKS